MAEKCKHTLLRICTESDGCYWVNCELCDKRSPRKHSQILALLAWIVSTANGHPRKRSRK